MHSCYIIAIHSMSPIAVHTGLWIHSYCNSRVAMAGSRLALVPSRQNVPGSPLHPIAVHNGIVYCKVHDPLWNWWPELQIGSQHLPTVFPPAHSPSLAMSMCLQGQPIQPSLATSSAQPGPPVPKALSLPPTTTAPNNAAGCPTGQPYTAPAPTSAAAAAATPFTASAAPHASSAAALPSSTSTPLSPTPSSPQRADPPSCFASISTQAVQGQGGAMSNSAGGLLGSASLSAAQQPDCPPSLRCPVSATLALCAQLNRSHTVLGLAPGSPRAQQGQAGPKPGLGQQPGAVLGGGKEG